MGKIRTLLSSSVPGQPLKAFSDSEPVTQALPTMTSTTAYDSTPTTIQLPLFCVLDETQHAATQHSVSFRSDQNALSHLAQDRKSMGETVLRSRCLHGRSRDGYIQKRRRPGDIGELSSTETIVF